MKERRAASKNQYMKPSSLAPITAPLFRFVESASRTGPSLVPAYYTHHTTLKIISFHVRTRTGGEEGGRAEGKLEEKRSRDGLEREPRARKEGEEIKYLHSDFFN